HPAEDKGMAMLIEQKFLKKLHQEVHGWRTSAAEIGSEKVLDLFLQYKQMMHNFSKDALVNAFNVLQLVVEHTMERYKQAIHAALGQKERGYCDDIRKN